MYTVTIRFDHSPKSDTEAAVSAVWSVLAAWCNNGQILGDSWPMASTDEHISVYASLPERSSLDDAFSNRRVTEAVEALPDIGVSLPKVEILGPDPNLLDPCACVSRGSFILFTNFLTNESPLRCGDCFKPVPLYRIPPPRSYEFFDFRAWEGDYQACDSLQMQSGWGERFGLRQLQRHDSGLSMQGRAICADIEESTGVPAYYYLHKWRGRSRAKEQERRCPDCGGAWLLAEPLHELFDFRCEPCRLLSNIAFDAS